MNFVFKYLPVFIESLKFKPFMKKIILAEHLAIYSGTHNMAEFGNKEILQRKR